MGLCRELASHGHIVFAIDHTDGSNMYTELADGTPIYLDTKNNALENTDVVMSMGA